MQISTQTKLGVGSALAVIGGLGIVLPLLLGVPDMQSPWGFVLGFVVGLMAGCGGALCVAGLVERRRAS